ncbi:clan AA aspartic protease [candidate division KSB1 bacterium]|nr:clan AA aspartic protease [candidate division KSB1 bacterium]
MITGKITEELEPIINDVFIRTAMGKVIPVRTILDTGFNGSFCIPRKIIKELNLNPVALEIFELADGTKIEENIYMGEIVVDNQPFIIEISETDSETALMGMEMLLEKEAIFNLKTMEIKVI